MDVKAVLKSKKVIAALIALIVAILCMAFPEFSAVITSIGDTVVDTLTTDTAQAVSQTLIED